MRRLHVEIFALLLAAAFCGIILWRLLPVPTLPQTVHRAAALADVEADLCQLARAETRFFGSTGHYVSETELRSNGDSSLPGGGRWPYYYRIAAPVSDRFVVVATAQDALEDRPAAVVADRTSAR